VKDLKFLAGVFFEEELPKDRQFLFRYFRSDLEKQFLRYYYCFEEFSQFTDHTGYYCQKRWLRILEKRLKWLVDAFIKAKQDVLVPGKEEEALKTLGQIQRGKYKG
jgi:hypothetical protein